MGVALLHPQALPRHLAADASVRKGWKLWPAGATLGPHHPALNNVPADPPFLPAQNLRAYERLITEPASHLLAMCHPDYLSTVSANDWPNPSGGPTGLPHLPTRPAHHSQALGTWPNLSRPPDPSCPTHHGKLQALAPTTLLALLVTAPKFGLVAAEVTVATVHPPQAGCTGPTLAILPAVCVGLLGDKGNGAGRMLSLGLS